MGDNGNDGDVGNVGDDGDGCDDAEQFHIKIRFPVKGITNSTS